jgi:hypothetical protein
MTEAEWLACDDPRALLEHLGPSASGRKLRLFACGYLRETVDDPDDDLIHAIDVAEAVADGVACEPEVASTREVLAAGGTSFDLWLYSAAGTLFDPHPFEVARQVVDDVHCYDYEALGDAFDELGGLSRGADLLREVFGDPFRPVRVAPPWLTADVVSLARGIYAERAFDRLPILADALQDAGCDSDDVLSHCRGSGPHVRGCWVCDLVLEKE